MTGSTRAGGPQRFLPLWIVMLQVMTSLVVAAGFALIDTSEAMAALTAGAVCILPGGWFAWRSATERSPARLLGQGVMKFLLTVTLMALAIVAFQPAALGFFTAFVLMQTMYVAGPLAFDAARRH